MNVRSMNRAEWRDWWRANRNRGRAPLNPVHPRGAYGWLRDEAVLLLNMAARRRTWGERVRARLWVGEASKSLRLAATCGRLP